MIVMREVFKRDKPLDNGSGAVSLCVFHSNVKSDECGALTVTPTKNYCRRRAGGQAWRMGISQKNKTRAKQQGWHKRRVH